MTPWESTSTETGRRDQFSLPPSPSPTSLRPIQLPSFRCNDSLTILVRRLHHLILLIAMSNQTPTMDDYRSGSYFLDSSSPIPLGSIHISTPPAFSRERPLPSPSPHPLSLPSNRRAALLLRWPG